MSPIRWTGVALCMVLAATHAFAADFQAGISAGTAMLSGDNTSSDMGISAAASGEMHLTPYLSLGLTGGIQRMSGTAKVTDHSSIFHGSHPYETTFLMGGATLRLVMPTGTVRPYLSLGAGESLWIPGRNGDVATLPTKRKVSWAVSPYFSIGGGVSLPLDDAWALEFGGAAMYFGTDELDNVDDGYVSGGSGGNDYTMQAGFTLIYRFGGAGSGRGAATSTPVEPERVPRTPEPSQPPASSRPVPTGTVPPERQEPQPVPDAPVPDGTPTEIIETPSPEPAEPDTAGTSTATPPPATETESVSPVIEPAPARPAVQPRTVQRAYLVHVASFPEFAEADARAEILRGAGYRTAIRSTDRGDIGIWYRVYVGPYTVREEADQTAERLIQSGLSDYAAVVEDAGE